MRGIDVLGLFGILGIILAFWAGSTQAQQSTQRSEITLRTVIAQRDAAVGHAQLFQLDIQELQNEVAELKRKLAEAEKKAEPVK